MLEIIYQDDALVAVNKPAGMLVHRSWLDKHETQFVLKTVKPLKNPKNPRVELQDMLNNRRSYKVLVPKGRLMKLVAEHQDLVPTDGHLSNYR